MASHDNVRGYPQALLKALEPRHVLVSHYDDFFARTTASGHFAPLLTNASANRFMQRLADAVHEVKPRTPSAIICGPSTERWSMPVPQWPLYFTP